MNGAGASCPGHRFIVSFSRACAQPRASRSEASLAVSGILPGCGARYASFEAKDENRDCKLLKATSLPPSSAGTIRIVAEIVEIIDSLSLIRQ